MSGAPRQQRPGSVGTAPSAPRARGIAAWLSRVWVRVYTTGMPAPIRDRRRIEMEADLWERRQEVARAGAGQRARRFRGAGATVRILSDLLRGMLDDLAWRRETRVPEGREAGAGAPGDGGSKDPSFPLGRAHRRVRRGVAGLPPPSSSGSRFTAGLTDDLRHSVRLLARSPHIGALIVSILALGIGLNTTVFSYVEATVTNPFPFPDVDRLFDVVLSSHQRFSGPFNYRAFEALRDNNEIFDGVAGYRDRGYVVAIGDNRRPVRGAEVSAGIFEVLGVQPFLGRPFTSDEEGRGGAPVAVISHYIWQAWLDSDPGVLGRTIEIDGAEHTIVGVMPRGFKFYEGNGVWVPLPVDATTPQDDPYRFSAVARLLPGVGMAQAEAAMEALGPVIDPFLGDPGNDYDRLRRAGGFRLAPLATAGFQIPGRILVATFFQLTAGLVMLVVGANLAALLFARGMVRRREIAVRRALGATRFRLVRQITIENLLLALAGGVSGVLVAFWGHDLFLAALPMLAGLDLRLDLRVLAFAIGLAATAVLAFGSKPALELARTAPGDALKEAGSGATGAVRVRRWQDRLAVMQIALSLILLIGASLAVRSMLAIDDVDPGFDAGSVFFFYLSTTSDQPSSDLQDTTFRIAADLAARPGIEAVAWRGSATPAAVGEGRDLITGFIHTRDGPSSLAVRDTIWRGPAVPADFFRTFGLPLLGGRVFDAGDRPGTPLVVVLSERASQILWPGEAAGSAIGRQIRFPGAQEWLTVIGVVGSRVRVSVAGLHGSETGMRAEPWPDIYVAASQFDNRPSNNVIWVRPGLDRSSLSRLVRTAVANIEPGVSASSIQTLWELEYERLQGEYRYASRLLGALGSIALLLSALGTYSVISYSWAQRAREVGIRVALGATRHDVLGLVLRDTQKLALTGVVLGTLVSLGIYRLAARFLFEARSWDPVTYGGVALLLIATATLAGLGPARRATNTSPTEALRQE